ncbi:MAG: hypothetical protein U1F87_12650 [Kiritimatiellia bacterium]
MEQFIDASAPTEQDAPWKKTPRIDPLDPDGVGGTVSGLLRDGQAVGGMEQELRGLVLGIGRQWLEASLNEHGLAVPGDVAQPGERRLAGQKRVLHTLLGPVALMRTYYHDGMRQTGRHPMDDALGLVDGYTSAVASLIGRCAAELPFAQVGASFSVHGPGG